VVDGSKRIAELLGYTREETWDMPVEKIITGMSRQMFEHLRRNLKESHHVLIDARCFRKDGTSFAGEVGVSMLALTSEDNIVFAIRNVERRKNAMDELRRSQAALEAALAPAFVCDVEGFFQAVNPALLEAFGIPDAGQARNTRFMDLLPDAARLFLRATCGEKVRERLSVAAANGVQVKLDLSLVPQPGGSGQGVTGVAGSLMQL
jgi:PAS domain S-box-containing protein